MADEANVDKWSYGMAGQGGLAIAVQLFEKKILQDQLLDVQDHKHRLEEERRDYKEKIEQQKVDQAEIYNYLHKKLEDNYVQIAELEKKILDEQADREKEEDAFEAEIEKLEHSLLHDVKDLQETLQKLSEKQDILVHFQRNEETHNKGLAEKENELKMVKERNEKEKASLTQAIVDQDEVMDRLTGEKLEETCKRFQHESIRQLSQKSRKKMAQNKQIEAELSYQDHEISLLKERTAQAQKDNDVLTGRLRAARDMEAKLAKTSRYYQQLIKRINNELQVQEAERRPNSPDTPDMSNHDRQVLRSLRARTHEIQRKKMEVAEVLDKTKERVEDLEEVYAGFISTQADLIKLLLWSFDDALTSAPSTSREPATSDEDEDERKFHMSRTINSMISSGSPSRTTHPTPRKVQGLSEVESWPEDQLIPSEPDDMTPKQKRMIVRMLLEKMLHFQNMIKDECCRTPPPNSHPGIPSLPQRFPHIKVETIGWSPASTHQSRTASKSRKAKRCNSNSSQVSLVTKATGIPSWDALQPTISQFKAVQTRDVAVQTVAQNVYALDMESSSLQQAQHQSPVSAYKKITLFSVEENDAPSMRKKVSGKGRTRKTKSNLSKEVDLAMNGSMDTDSVRSQGYMERHHSTRTSFL